MVQKFTQYPLGGESGGPGPSCQTAWEWKICWASFSINLHRSMCVSNLHTYILDYKWGEMLPNVKSKNIPLSNFKPVSLDSFHNELTKLAPHLTCEWYGKIHTSKIYLTLWVYFVLYLLLYKEVIKAQHHHALGGHCPWWQICWRVGNWQDIFVILYTQHTLDTFIITKYRQSKDNRQ